MDLSIKLEFNDLDSLFRQQQTTIRITNPITTAKGIPTPKITSFTVFFVVFESLQQGSVAVTVDESVLVGGGGEWSDATSEVLSIETFNIVVIFRENPDVVASCVDKDKVVESLEVSESFVKSLVVRAVDVVES